MADNNTERDEEMADVSSPPCYMHEIDPAYAGLVVDPGQARDVARWRKTQRERLIVARLAVPLAAREACASRIAADLDRLVPDSSATLVSVYWPFRGESDLRPWMASAHARGIRVALPVVVAKGAPLVFREWHPH